MNTNCAIDLVSPERLQRIRELAEKATPGPWFNPGRQFIVSAASKDEPIICDVKSEDARNDLAYIAAVHPNVIRAMCEEIEHLRKQVVCLNREAEWLAEHMPKTSMIDGKAKVQCLRGMKEWRETARKVVEEGHHE